MLLKMLLKFCGLKILQSGPQATKLKCCEIKIP